MTAEPMTLKYQRLRAPQQDGQSFHLPPLEQFSQIWLDNLTLTSSYDFEVFDTDIQSLRAQASEDLVQQGLEYTRAYRDVRVTKNPKGLILSGHQPALFHPGVWYKNFVLHRLASQTDAIGVNLVIDNDLCASRQISVPTGSIDDPRLASIKFDEIKHFVPFETALLENQQLWRSFPDRVCQCIRPFVDEPLVKHLWKYVLDAGSNGLGPTYCVAAGRHRLESDHGLQTLEVPLSHVCRSGAFAKFAAELISRFDEFRDYYNRSLRAYRELHRIRSQTHPVPELAKYGQWTEVPFWIWFHNQPTRKRLFVKKCNGTIRFSNAADWEMEFDHRRLDQQIARFDAKGICLRPKALITTMYSRLVLGSCFLHGIGGAKYDQLTDLIARQFFGVESPMFLTITATHRLPLQLPDVEPTDVADINIQLRNLVFHAEQFVPPTGEAKLLTSRKSELLQAIPTHGEKLPWHREITAINESLQPMVENVRQNLIRQREEIVSKLAQKRVLDSREFSFCLFPESLIEKLNEDS